MVFILLILLGILPGGAYADLLHINDGDESAGFRSTGGISPDENKDFLDNYSTRPGSPWEFGFAFKKSPAKFNWKIEVVVTNEPREAGHNHNNPPPELFYFPDWPDKKTVARLDGLTVQSPLLDQSQKFIVHLATVNYATRLTARGTYTQFFYGKTLHPTLTHVLNVKTPDLEPLPRNDRLYRYGGVMVAHPDNHYGTAVTVAALKDLATAWKNAHSALPLLEIGNISLPWGGALDKNANWKSIDSGHAFGIAADIGKRGFNNDERADIIKLMCGNGFYVSNTTEDNKEHYHITHKKEFNRIKGLKWPIYLPDKTDGAIIDCCAAKPGSPDYQKCVGFLETTKSRSPVSIPPPISRQ